MTVEIRCCEAMPDTHAGRLVHLRDVHYGELPAAGKVFLDDLFDKILPELFDRISSDLALMREELDDATETR